MSDNTPPRWLTWAREIQALAQTGLHYAPDDYHRQRYQRLAEIAAEITSEYTDLAFEPLRDAFQAEAGYATPKVDVRAAVFIPSPVEPVETKPVETRVVGFDCDRRLSLSKPRSPLNQRRPKLLMVRERGDSRWTLPGGWADVGDVPSEAAERETWEEAGFRVKARKLISVYDANRIGPLEFNHAYKLVFLCELIDGAPTPSNETSEVAFFAWDELPAALSGERTRPRHLADAFAALADPHVPTLFD
jgi:ADP-ribose pyrophosphatase YjhB (NUDIX family)